ncbi:MAG: amidohydrolase family protein [Planctomycetota bacterium]|jgi:imidazolonepropionase-like amidohydrolase
MIVPVLLSILLLSVLPGVVGAAPQPIEEGKVYVIKAGTLYDDEGRALEPAVILVRGTRIVQVAQELEMPEGAEILSCEEGGFLTPGLIDAASRTGVVRPSSWAEHASEVIPHLDNIHALDLTSKQFDRLVEQGVTSVYVTPDPASVIGCQGTVVKTSGPAEERILKQSADVKASLGPEGWQRGSRNRSPRGAVDFRTRRPTTRMGMAWVFRKAFYDAAAYLLEKREGRLSESEHDPALDALAMVLEKKMPLRIQAREDIDIWSAIRMCKEFGLNFILEEGTEAYRCIPELKASGVPVIFGPITLERSSGSGGSRRGYQGRGGGRLRHCLNTAGLLRAAGIPLALTAAGRLGEDALPHQACYAIRCGLSFEDALQATTATPAKLLGISDRVGRLEPGMDADLVLWTAQPFSPQAKPALVMISGSIVYKDEAWMGAPAEEAVMKSSGDSKRREGLE